MILSVIIVNYNVKRFLEQCLHSVERSLSGLGPAELSEVIVVDNQSQDGSIGYLAPRFPGVRFIANTENGGFSKANNQALRLAKGKYVVFLNPDTILSEDTCKVCVDFLEAQPAAGAAGVRMVDGQGRFLPESRRGFPTAWVSFCRLSGLAFLFPRSRWFAGYYMGYMPEGETHAAPILSGACMWCRREILDRVGGFDERFFMYGEDIDLSYRIEAAGYTNYYIATTTIVHFKGESTRKDLSYTKQFYKAMSQFRKKYQRGGISGLSNGLIEAAIWMRAAMAGVMQLWAQWRGGAGGSARLKRPMDKGGFETPGAVWMEGDALVKEALRRRVPGIRIAANAGDATEIILCQGAAYSFVQCIEALEQRRWDVPYKIHAAGSDSMAGSHSQIDLLVFEEGEQIVPEH